MRTQNFARNNQPSRRRYKPNARQGPQRAQFRSQQKNGRRPTSTNNRQNNDKKFKRINKDNKGRLGKNGNKNLKQNNKDKDDLDKEMR